MVKERDIVEETKAITIAQVDEFLSEKNGAGVCSCGNGEYSLAHEESMIPSLLATPDPRDRGTYHWFFWLICGSCAHVRLISAASVWEHFYVRDSENEQ